ncbi:MAG: restriction endonuclease [Xanthobacteraceae bacterium]|nr:restriction endonuclease [Xanthobacteraceae bacterium]
MIDLIHVHGGAVADDDRFLAGWCNCEVRTWRRLRARLIDCELLYERDGTLRNERADDEAEATRNRHACAKAAGRASGLARAIGSREVNDLAATPVGEPEVAEDPVPLVDHARAAARAGIEAHLARLGPYEMQELAAALLRAMGHVTHVSPPGPDGGTDILALPDALGAGTPHIRVQVKHRTAPTGRAEIAALRGILAGARETGLFISTGGFTPDARREASRAGARVRLIDRDEFIDLWIRHQERVPEDARARLRLVPVWFLETRVGAVAPYISASCSSVARFSRQ